MCEVDHKEEKNEECGDERRDVYVYNKLDASNESEEISRHPIKFEKHERGSSY